MPRSLVTSAENQHNTNAVRNGEHGRDRFPRVQEDLAGPRWPQHDGLFLLQGHLWGRCRGEWKQRVIAIGMRRITGDSTRTGRHLPFLTHSSFVHSGKGTCAQALSFHGRARQRRGAVAASSERSWRKALP